MDTIKNSINKDSIILVGFSGGMDSVACLIHCLKEFPNTRVIAHHISINNSSKSINGIETLSCKRLVKLINDNIRKFSFTESYIESESLVVQLEIIASTLASVAKRYKATHICDGRRLRNKNNISFINNKDDESIFLKYVDPIYSIIHPEHIGYFPMSGKTKTEVLETLPEWAKDNYWSCFFPKLNLGVYSPCGECSSCKEHNDEGLVHPITHV